MKILRSLIVLAIPAIAMAQVYNYFPAPGIIYTLSGGMALGSPTGGVQGAGTLNMQGCYVNGVACSTSTSSGTVTTVSVATANGLSGTVANPTTTPAITLAPTFTGIGYSTGSALQAAVAGNFPTLNQSTTGNAATATTAGALTASPSLCSSGQAAQGVLANGNATGCITPYSVVNESANTIFSGPSSGTAALPTFRSMVANDLPLSASFTWTGNITYTPGSGVGVTINGAASSDSIDINNGVSRAANIIGNSGTGTSDGLAISAGTNSSDYALDITNRAGSSSLFRIFGDGSVVVGSPTGGAEGAGTVNAQDVYVNGVALGASGSGILTYVSGCSAGTFAPSYGYSINGDAVVLRTGASTCTSTSGAVTASLPVAITPANSQNITVVIESAGTYGLGFAVVTSGGQLQLSPVSTAFGGAGSGWNGMTITYSLAH